MNRIYKLKFDKRRNELVIVSEITAGAGKEKSTGHIADLTALSPFRKLLGTLTPVALLTGLIAGLLPAMVLAADLPTGGQIVGGQGSISTSGNQMTIHQQTQKMATNWHSFDIGKNNTVQFVQPDSSSVALNRVTGASGSQIMGTLKANGQVFILNPNGVLFGKDARVNVGGLVASTKNLSTADFMNGQYTLSGNGNPGAQVVNQGSLTTSKGGYIVLAGEQVSNSGTITTPGGKTVLAAGKTVTLQLDNGGLTSVSVNGSVVNALVENRGLISATNGQVYLTAKGQDMLLNTVVNNSGTIEAKGLVSRGGEIVLNGGDSGVVSQSGLLLADSQSGQGGKITLEGQNIHLAGNSLTSASGKTGGGEVYVGGGWQGQDSHIKNASKVVMDKSATVDVSATDTGNGGTAVLWSDDYTNFRGRVLAKGGAQSGNGGRVETSSHQNLQASGEVDVSARAGHGGEWLLDPTDVTIVGTGADTDIDSATADGTDIFTPAASGAQILNSSIVNQLNAGTNVTVKTSGTDTAGQSGNIAVNANIVKSAGADAKLTLLADNNIRTGDRVSIGASTGKLNLDLLAGNTTNNASISLGKFINISINGGDLLADAGNLTIADDISGVTAGATGNGTALVVNNASIHSDGYTDSGKDFVINASVSGNGTAIKTQGGSQLDEVVLNGEATGGGTAVELGGKVSGANITGTSDSGTAVRVTDGAGVDGSVVKGHSDSGTGLQVSGNASLSNTGLSGTTQTGTGAAVTGSLTADNASQVTGSATQDGGAGVTLDGTVTGATVTGEATNGDAVRIADGSLLTGADIKGTSVTGTGIKTQGNISLEGGTQLAGGSEQGAALDVSGTLNHDPDSSVTTTPDNTGSVIGHENIHEVIPVVLPTPEEGGNSQPDHLPDTGSNDNYTLTLNKPFSIGPFQGATASLSVGRTRSMNEEQENQVFLSVTLPFGLNRQLSYALQHDSNGRMNQTATLYNQPSPDMSWNISAGTQRDEGQGQSGLFRGDVQKTTPYGQGYVGLSMQGGQYKNLSASWYGSFTATQQGAAFHQNIAGNEPRLMVDTGDVAGVPVDGGNGITNRLGVTVVQAGSSYEQSDTTVDVTQLPADVSVTDDVISKVLTEGAIGYRKISASKGGQMVATIRMVNGHYPPFGTVVKNNKGKTLGMIGDQGFTWLSGLTAEDRKTLKITWTGGQCTPDLPEENGLQAGVLLIPCR